MMKILIGFVILMAFILYWFLTRIEITWHV